MGFGEWLEEDPRGRFCMLNRRNYTRNGHDWNPMPDMELDSLRGVRIFGRGLAKRRVRTNPPIPPGYGHTVGFLPERANPPWMVYAVSLISRSRSISNTLKGIALMCRLQYHFRCLAFGSG